MATLPRLYSTEALEAWPADSVARLLGRLDRAHLLLGTWNKAGQAPTEAVLRADWYAVDQTKQISGRPVSAQLRRFFRAQEAEVLALLPDVVAPLQGLLQAEGRPGLAKFLQARGTLWFMPAELERASALLEDRGHETILRKQDPAIGQALIDIEAWSDEIESQLGPLFRDVAERGFNSGAARAGVSGIDFTSDHPVVARSMFESLSRARGVNETTARILSRRIEAGLIEGRDLAGLEKIVRGVFTEARGYRTRMITRTTVTAGFESGQVAAYDEAAVARKAWLTERDALVREGTVYNHVIMDGVEVAVMEPFLVPPGEMMMHPGDPAGSAGNVINCRCTTRPVLQN